MGCVAVASLLRTIELEFLQDMPRPVVLETDIISFNKELIQSFQEELGFLMKQLDEKRMDGVEAIKHLEMKLRDLAFRVEDDIEFQIAHLYDRDVDDEVGIADLFVEEEDELRVADLYVEKPQRNTDAEKTREILQWSMEEMKAIKEELEKIKNGDELEGRKTTLDVLPTSELDSSHSVDKMVGKTDEFEIIKKLLTEFGTKQRKVVSVIGMGGIGKTTLAQQLYKDPSIAIHFDMRAWVVASQLHNKRQMLVGLLNSISKQGSVEGFTDEDLALKLYQYLKRQRYMVVIDDVWSRKAWDDVSTCFPDDGNGSRVLLTTRLVEVANYTNSDSNFSHQMQLLDQSESWKLFCEKACRSGGGGVEFETIWRPIVEKCRGLPLAIVVVAGLFSKLNTPNEWENIAKALDSSATTVDATCLKIFSLSYNHLPHYLKACFLYLGVFPEDYDINANELTRLWSAEGFVKASENENFDEVAKRYVQELMDRNLILVSKWSCCGRKIKVFRVHDLLHSFCVREAQNNNLLHVVRESDSNFPYKCFRWLSIQSSDFDVSSLYYSSRGCRSIFFFTEYEEVCTILNLKNLKLLRVFFFLGNWMSKDIVDLVHLRYLNSKQMYLNIFKPSWAWNLQTLLMGSDDKSIYWEFPQLQYFLCSFICRHPPKFVLRNLQSIFCLNPCHCTKEFLTRFPYLKKLGICGETRECNECIENLVYLQQLERLYVNANEYYDTSPNMVQINNHIVLLKNLKRLKFVGNCFEWNGINVLSKLPRLEVLKLIMACIGEEWELPENDKFCQLIFLSISSTRLKDWKATGDHFPKLEHLSLYSCHKLKEIPSGFADISTLKSIKLLECHPSVATSANEIKEEQLDYLNNIVEVIVTKLPFRYELTMSDKYESDKHESDEQECDEL